MFDLSSKEKKIFNKLNTPSKIQDFLNSLKFNFEEKKETCSSPRTVLGRKSAHCQEGALLASAILWYHGKNPLILDLKSAKNDYDHVVALFKENGFWGAISKTNHSVLRYREPVYKAIRELAMSYFHEYFLNDGTKTMRSYSKPFNLKKLGTEWVTSKKDLWYIGSTLDDSKHFPVLSKKQIKNLRKADKIEIKTSSVIEHKK